MTEVPQLETPFDEVLNAFAELGNDADPTRVELVTSEILGEWWEADDDLAAGLIDLAARTAEPERLVPALAALRVLATDEDHREAAGLALEKFGLPEPAWAPRLNQVTAGECWRTTDVYGDESSVLVSFGTHGLVVSINYGSFGGWVTDAAIVESPQDVLAELRAVGESTSERIGPEVAHEVVADAFAGTEWQAEPEVGEDFVRFRALALARLRTLPSRTRSRSRSRSPSRSRPRSSTPSSPRPATRSATARTPAWSRCASSSSGWSTTRGARCGSARPS